MTTTPPMPNAPTGSDLCDLTVGERLELLSRSLVGRITWCGPDGPQVVPLSTAMHNGAADFCTLASSALALVVRGCRPRRVTGRRIAPR